MIKLFTFILLFFALQSTFSQQPIHANWYFGGASVWNPFDQFTFHLHFEKDTVLKGKVCSFYSGNTLACTFTQNNKYFYSQNDKIYFYEELLDTFQVIYDFAAVAGDEYQLVYHSTPGILVDTTIVKIDSVGTMNINNKILRKQYVHYFLKGSMIEYHSVILERIGDVQQFFNITTNYMYCDADYPTGIRCYEDSVIGIFHTDTLPCNYTTSVEETKVTNIPSRIIPNPVSSFFSLENEDMSKYEYVLYNSIGLEIKTGRNSDFVSMEGFSNGLYIIALKDMNSGKIQKLKLLKN